MQRHLNLIKTGHQEVEKRVFPRFPFSYLIFKDELKTQKTYEVKDISYTGMSLNVKDGECELALEDKVSGEIHWHGQVLKVEAIVKRVSSHNFGVEFVDDGQNQKRLKKFLSIKNIAKCMKPIHEYKSSMELPANLAYWLRCDGPFELFMWQHNDNELSKIQLIMMNSFIEWNDGKGLTSGKVLSIRDHDTPLLSEEEFEFLLDDGLDEDKLSFAHDMIAGLNQELLPEEAYQFLCRKFNLN
jgi:hypothetical protein